MKKPISLIVFLFFLTMTVFAQATRKAETRVEFRNLGDYSTVNTTYIQGDKSRTDTENEFKGNGLLNSAMAKIFLKSGDEGELTDLSAMKIYKMDHKKKRYSEIPIQIYAEKMDSVKQIMSEEGMELNEPEEEAQEEPAQEESPIKVIRRVFEVENTGEKKRINQFSCNQYTILWLREWENTETKDTGTDSLFTEVWTTPVNGNMKNAQQVEQDFSKLYMEKMGFDVETFADENYGMNWIQLFSRMNPGEASSEEISWGDDVDKLKQIEGYPIVVDGRFYMIRPHDSSEEMEEEQDEPTANVRKLFGRLAKKVVKKKIEPKKEEGPDVRFYTEVKEYGTTDIDESLFQVPGDYKKEN